MKQKDNLNTIRQYLPFSIKAAADKFPSELQEIRLRVNKPIVLHIPDRVFYISNNLSLSNKFTKNLVALSQSELSETFTSMCSYSVYSKQNEIINGYITLKGGNRAGICGTAVVQNGRIINIRDITSINIRLCFEREGSGDELLSHIEDVSGGVLLCGAPCSGKTTILRDIARQLSYRYKISLIDCRSELAAVYGGIPQNDIGMCDVLNSYTKHDGFEQAVRCLSPEIIICDEIGGYDDAQSVLNARKSGVSVIASAHCRGKNVLCEKQYLKSLVKTRCFETIVFLGSGRNVGTIEEIIKSDELF